MTDQPALLLRKEWKDITVEYGLMEAVGDFDFTMPKHAISVAFIPHDRVTWSVDGLKQTTPLPAGSTFLYGDREFIWHQRTKPSEYVTISLEPEFLRRTAIENELSAETKLAHRVIFPDSIIVQVAHLFKGELLSEGLAGILFAESLKNLLAVHLLRQYCEQAPAKKLVIPAGALDVVKLKQIQDYIEENLADEIVIEDLAALIPMSQFHFARAFKAASGDSPHKYLTQRRLERAKVLLTVTKLPVAEIAYRVGFSNQSHFTAHFRKVTGVTPKNYRSQCS
ncbi:helix-turn-helix transcriptional regulator [Leptolyngbya sp. FACHB-321]|uniref:helix-turn-helix domain-containing protein n=1 Tax=Leptolyngbya sp. FACHB-321 TaxID=2692807 RepID=UPI00168635D2|nr:AraC family transcriptional regulator [Leptolyngbya sp. FACHB-321]MBD2034479.1 helix-turn-helix transcriptional regulator [Leptolyngbya sp. FACHB-321]